MSMPSRVTVASRHPWPGERPAHHAGLRYNSERFCVHCAARRIVCAGWVIYYQGSEGTIFI